MNVLIIGEEHQYVKGIIELNEKEEFPHHFTILASDKKHKKEEFSSFSDRGLTYEFNSYRSTKILSERASEYDLVIYTANPKNNADYGNR
jgi:hypothetical protein